jgi:threonine dehydrogenase-like Zn-dependent dehydrogenase
MEDLEIPSLLPDEVLIRVGAAGICGTDLEIYNGVMYYFTSGMARVPITLGHEWAGEVVDVGTRVTRFKKGDLATGECTVSCMRCEYCRRGWYNQCPSRTETGILNRDGGFAEYIAFPEAFLHKANGLQTEEAALIEPTAISLYATKLAHVTPGDRVAVMGPGPIGLFAVQTVKAYGARQVILVGTQQDRLNIGGSVGADALVNIRDTDIREAIQELTDGHMVDVVLEAVGKPAVWENIASIVAPRARVVIIGLFAGKKCSVDFDLLVEGNITIQGSLGSPGVWDEAIDLHRRGVVSAAPVITHRLALERFVDGMKIARNRTDSAVKVVLQP